MRAGDTVYHFPSKETWVLSTDPENGYVTWYGWPEGEARESDCELIEACTDAEHVKALQDWGGVVHMNDNRTGTDIRHERAKRQLQQLVLNSQSQEE